jgi:hypothetical protein
MEAVFSYPEMSVTYHKNLINIGILRIYRKISPGFHFKGKMIAGPGIEAGITRLLFDISIEYSQKC